MKYNGCDLEGKDICSEIVLNSEICEDLRILAISEGRLGM